MNGKSCDCNFFGNFPWLIFRCQYMTTIDNEIKQKLSFKYFCNFCDYKTSKKGNFNTHLNSLKHSKTTVGNNFKPFLSQKYTCQDCDKTYNDRAGLWRHKKK